MKKQEMYKRYTSQKERL